MAVLNRVLRTCVTGMALVGTLWPAAAARAATCGPSPDVIAGADIVFVGTLTSVTAAGMQGTFAVEEVWKGDLPPIVEVTGNPEQWSGPVDRVRWLVLATVVGNSLRVGGECNQAYPWDPSYAVSRPAGAHPPEATSEEGGLPVPLLVITGVLALLVVVSAVAFRPTRAPTS